MTKQPRVELDAVVETVGPRTLVLHPGRGVPADAPAGHADSLHTASSSLSYFRRIIEVAPALAGLREIAVAVADAKAVEAGGKETLQALGSATVSNGLNFSAIVHFEQIQRWGVAAFAPCKKVAIRVATDHFPTLRLPRGFFEQVTALQAEGCVVSLHVYLDSRMLELLTLPRLRRWLTQADYVRLLVPRHTQVDFSRKELSAFFERISPLWEKPDRFFHLRIDRCIKPQFFPWNQLPFTSPGTDDVVNLGWDGGLSFCATDAPMAHIDQPTDLAGIVTDHYAKHARLHQSTCPNIRFAPD